MTDEEINAIYSKNGILYNGVNIDHVKILNKNKIVFSKFMKTKNYYLYNKLDELKKAVEKDNNLFEIVIFENKYNNRYNGVKFCIDIDTDIFISYNSILNYVKSFKSFINDIYKIEKSLIKYNCHISLCDGVLKHKDINTEFINSCHLIFNIHIKNADYAKNILNQFNSWYYDNNGYSNEFHNTTGKMYVDMSIYSKLKKFRSLNQTKMNKPKNILKKVEYCEFTNQLQINNNINSLDFVNILEEDILNKFDYIDINKLSSIDLLINKFDNELNEKNENATYLDKQDFNKYNIEIKQNLKMMTKVFDNLSDKTLLYNNSWFSLLNQLVYSLLTFNKNINIDQALKQNATKMFLKKSRIGKYDTDEFYYKNVNILKKLLNNPSIELDNIEKSNLILLPTEEIINYINDKLKNIIDNFKIDDIIYKQYNTKKYYIINNIYAYDINKNELLINFIEYRNSKNNIIKYTAPFTYNYIIDNIKKSYENEDHKNKKILNDKLFFFNEWDEIDKDINKSSYICAPTGSGKSYFYLRILLTTYLKNNYNENIDNKRILIIGDIRTLCLKTFTDIINICNELDINANYILKHYEYKTNDHVLDKFKLNDYELKNIQTPLIYITTYDSLNKLFNQNINFEYVIIDEFKNTIKRLFTIQNKSLTNEEKIALCSNFITFLKNAKAVHLLDADMDLFIIDILLTNIRKDINFYKLNVKNRDKNIYIIQYETTWFHILEKKLDNNEKIVIPTMSLKTLKEVYSHIIMYCEKKNIQNKKILCIDKTGALDFNNFNDNTDTLNKSIKKIETIKNTDEVWSKYDIVIYTATITCGISFNKLHFNSTMVYLNNDTLDYTQACQFLERVRNTINNELILGVRYKTAATLKNILYNYNNDFDKFKFINNHNKNKNKNDKTLSYIVEPLTDINNKNNTIQQTKNNARDLYDKLNKCDNLNKSIKKNIYMFKVIQKLCMWGYVNIKSLLNYSHVDYPLINNLTINYDVNKYKNKNVEDNLNLVVDYNKNIICCNNQYTNKVDLKVNDTGITKETEQLLEKNCIRSSTIQHSVFMNLHISKFLKIEEIEILENTKYKNNNDDGSQVYADYKKSKDLHYHGITHYLYNVNSDIVNSYYARDMENIKQPFISIHRLRYYYIKHLIYSIVDNFNVVQTYEEINKKSKKSDIMMYYDDMLIKYVAFKFLEIIGLTIFSFYYRLIPCGGGYRIIKDKELMDKFYNFIDMNKEKVDYLLKCRILRIRSITTDRYKLIKSLVVSSLKYVGINISFGKNITDRHIKDRTMVINTVLDIRVQCELDNEEDDKKIYEFYQKEKEKDIKNGCVKDDMVYTIFPYVKLKIPNEAELNHCKSIANHFIQTNKILIIDDILNDYRHYLKTDTDIFYNHINIDPYD